MSCAPRCCHADVRLVEVFTHGHLRELGNVFFPRMQPRALWARVAHAFVATFFKALRSFRTAAPVRTAAVPGLLARPLFFRRRHQLSCQQPSPRSWPGLSSSRAVDGASWGGDFQR